MSRSETQGAVSALRVAEGKKDMPQSEVTSSSNSFPLVPGKSNSRGSGSSSSISSPGTGCRRQDAPPPPPPTPRECRLDLQVCRHGWGWQTPHGDNWLWRRGLFHSNCKRTSPTQTFASVLSHVQSALDFHASVRGHCTPGTLVASATPVPNFTMLGPMEVPRI